MSRPETLTGVRLVAGRYRLRDRLGRGGMGQVWAAEDELLQRSVAVKEIHFPPGIADEERATLRERTIREARAAARLDHPCAVRVFDVVEDEGHPFIVMELLPGRSLSDVVRSDGPLSAARAAHIGLCLLEALEAAHAAGIVHRDVKPGNVVVCDDGRVALTDFGIASTEGDPSITSSARLLGSPAYIAPERARGGTPEPPSDLFSLGSTLYTAVEGHPPFDRDDPVATLTAVVNDKHQPCERAGAAMREVLDRLLRKDPAERPSPAQLRTWLEAIVADPDQQVAPPFDDALPEPTTGGETVALVAGDLAPSTAGRAVAMAALAVLVFLSSAAAAWFATH